MPTPVRDAQSGFSGGINTVSDPIALQPNQIRRAVNARINQYGAIEKRLGSVKTSTNPLPSAGTNGFGWVKDNGDAFSFVMGANGVLYYAQFSDGNVLPAASWTAAAWTGGTGSFSTTVTPTFCSFRDGSTGADAVFIADGGKLVHWHSGTNLLVREGGTSSHSASYIKVHNQRIWGCGDPDYPDSIFYSKLNDGSSFGHAGGGEIVVRTFSDEKVVALASVGSSLLIFHRRGISRLTGFGQDDITVQPEGVSSQTGTLAPLSIVETDGAAFFVSDRGAFVATEGSVSQLGTPATPDPLLPIVESLSASSLANIRGVLSRRTQEIWWFVPGYGVYVYHLVLRAWSGPWTGEYLTTGGMWTCPVEDEAELFVVRSDTSDNSVRLCEFPGVYTDGAIMDTGAGGTAVSMAVQLRRMYFNDDSQAKALRFGYLTARLTGSATLNVQWKTNEGTAQALITAPAAGSWTTSASWNAYGATWTGPVDSDSYRIDMGLKGYWTDVTLSSSENNIPVISRWQMDGFILGRR